MKLSPHLFRCIRRCCYTAAFTLAAASLLPGAHAAEIYNTDAIIAAVQNGSADIRSWTMFRPTMGHPYHLFILNSNTTQFSGNEVVIDHAIRPTVQTGLTDEVGFDVTKISYIGSRSITPKLGEAENVGDDIPGGSAQNVPPSTTPIHTNNNRLSITNSGFHLAVGAYTQYGDACNNSVYIQDVRYSDDIWGAASHKDGDANNNSVTVFRAEALGDKIDPVLGLYTLNNAGKIIGGWSRGKGTDANGNKVFVYGSFVWQQVSGGVSAHDALNNEVYIVKSHIGTGGLFEPIVGGEARGNGSPGSASGNIVTIDDSYNGWVPEEVDDGSQAGGVRTATVPDVSLVQNDIIGGVSTTGFGNDGAHDNIVRLTGITTPNTKGTGSPLVTTTIEGDIIGGKASNNASSGYEATDRSATAGSASGNLIDIEGVNIMSDCVVTLNDGSQKTRSDVGKVYGGYVDAPSYAGQTPGNANNNVVQIKDSYIENSVYGGYNESPTRVVTTDAEGKQTTFGDASFNQQHFENLRTPDDKDLTFYCGWAKDGNTNNNTVYLHGAGWSMARTFLHGGWGEKGYALDSFKDYDTYTRNNRLRLQGFQGKLRGFDHFEHLHFTVTEEVDRSQPMLIITGSAAETGLTAVKQEGASPTPIKVTADISPIANQLQVGDIIPLFGQQEHEEIAGTKDIDKDSVVDDSKRYRRGVTSEFTLDTEFKQWEGGPFDNFGVIEVVGRTDSATPEATALIEGRIATLTLNNMAGDLVAEQAVASAARAIEGTPGAANHYIPVAQAGKDGKGGVIYVPKDELEPGRRLFFVMNGAHNKVDSGSTVDVDGVNALVGISQGILERNALTLAGFLETGWGQYATHNHFGTGAWVPWVRGSGETSYVGAGALMRYCLGHLNKKLGAFTLDASLRGGRQETDYCSTDLMSDDGTIASYEQESSYIAGHVGINYTFQLADAFASTLYARYLWTHIGSDEAEVCNERVTFQSMNSNRVRLGDRVVWKLNDNWQPYAGAAYEWEFSGTARAETHGLGITAPSMRGGTIIAEIGTVWQPSLTRALWLEVGAEASLGKHEGYSGKVGVSIGF